MIRNQLPVDSDRPRLLLVTDAALPYVCGVSTIVDELTRHFSELNQWDVLVLAPDNTYPTLNGIEVIGLPCYSVPMYKAFKSIILGDPRVRRKTKRCLLDFQPHIIMTLGGAFLARMASQIGKMMDIPVLGLNDTDFVNYGSHYGLGFLSPLLIKLMKWIHTANTATLVSSPSYSKRLQDMGFDNLKLWRFGINTERFSPKFRNEALRQKIMNTFPDTRLICLCVSRMASEKSIDELYAIAQLEGVTLVLVGDGPDRENLEGIFSGTRTIFWGALFGEELSQMYASVDVFLTASRSETFGLTVVEAMASGLACVVIDGNGTRDNVVHEETGFIASSPDEMAQYVAQLKDDKSLLATMGRDGLQRCEAFSWDKAIHNLNDILFDVLIQHHHVERDKFIYAS